MTSSSRTIHTAVRNGTFPEMINRPPEWANTVFDGNKPRVFKVDISYNDGRYQYMETIFYRGSRQQLEQEVRRFLDEQADDDQVVCWSFEDQEATTEDACLTASPHDIEVSAVEIRSLDDLPIEDLSAREEH